MTRARGQGFTLIEVMVVVVVIGIIAAIMIPNLLNALQRGRQKRTLGDIHAVGTAVAAYEADRDKYPLQAATAPLGNMQSVLEPTFIQALPTTDGWGRDFTYLCAGGASYTLVSKARDGVSNGPASGPTSNFNNDIVFSDGQFVTFPEGIQN